MGNFQLFCNTTILRWVLKKNSIQNRLLHTRQRLMTLFLFWLFKFQNGQYNKQSLINLIYRAYVSMAIFASQLFS